MGAQHDVVTAGMVPRLDLDTDALRQVAADMRSTASTARDAMGRIATGWRNLEGAYQAPEAPRVLSVMDPAVDGVEDHAQLLEVVSGALSAFADDVEVAQAQLRTISADVADLGAAVGLDADWRDSPRILGLSTGIAARIRLLESAVREAEAACASTILNAAPPTPWTPPFRPDDVATFFGFSPERQVDRIEELLAGAADPYSTAMYGHLELLRDGLVSGKYDGAAVFEAFQRLTPEQVASLEQYLGSVHAMGHSDLVASFSSPLLAGIESENQVRTMLDSLPSLEPKVSQDVSRWVTTDPETIMEGVERASHEDVNQVFGNDCWLLAGLGAALVSRPDQIKDNITSNSNGTYTVTLYPDGKATDVTVSGDVPMGQEDLPYYSGSRDPAGPNWVSIYEKAAAQLVGGGSYSGLTAGHPASGIEITTGRETDTYGPSFRSTGDVTVADVQKLIDEKRPMTCLTQFRGSDGTIAPWHVYYVTGVDADGLIEVRNPWGFTSKSGVQEVLHLTEDEFNRTFELESSGR